MYIYVMFVSILKCRLKSKGPQLLRIMLIIFVARFWIENHKFIHNFKNFLFAMHIILNLSAGIAENLLKIHGIKLIFLKIPNHSNKNSMLGTP